MLEKETCEVNVVAVYKAATCAHLVVETKVIRTN